MNTTYTSTPLVHAHCNNPTLEGLVMQQVTIYLREYLELSLYISFFEVSERVLLSEVGLYSLLRLKLSYSLRISPQYLIGERW